MNGDLHADGAQYDMHPVFNLRMPRACPGVESFHIESPRRVERSRDAYDAAADKLRGMFRANFDKQGFKDFGIQAVV